MGWALELQEGGGSMRLMTLQEGRSNLGRAPENEISIPHQSLSRRHAQLDTNEQGVWIEDLGSKNGTWVGGLRLRARQQLHEGEKVRLGELDAVLRRVNDRTVPVDVAAMSRVMRRPDTNQFEQNELRLKLLLRSAQLLSAPADLPNVLSRVLDLMSALLTIDRACILLRNDEGQLRSVCTWGTPPGEDDQPYSEKIALMAEKQGRAMLFDDVRQAGALAGSRSVVLQDIRSSMAAPLLTGTGSIGVLYVDNLAFSHAFNDADLELLNGFANQAAMAIENARLARRLSDEAVVRSTFQRFFPPSTVQKLMQRKGGEVETELVKVTTLFSDITSFTQLSGEMAPERVVRLLNLYFPVMAGIVFGREGTLEKYIGDALMAVWGAPFSHPDDADRAVDAAVAMQRALLDLRPVLAAEGLPPIQVHIGVHSGPAAFANIGSAEYLQFATVGISTSAAARICNEAAAGEIVISDAVRAELKTRYTLEAMPPALMKGIGRPMTLWKLRWT